MGTERLDETFHWKRHKKGDFVQSFIFPYGGILAIRVIMAVYTLAMLFYGLYLEENFFFIYYTDLNYLILCIYFTIIALYGVHFLWKVEDKESFVKLEATHFDRFIWVLFQFVTTNALFLDTVFWALLYSGGIPSAWTVSSHSINSALVLMELLMNKLSFAAIHLIVIIAFGLAYVFFSWIYHAVTSVWIYDFLAWNSAWTALDYIGIFIGGLIYFFVLRGLQRLRNKILSKSTKSVSAMELEEGTNKQTAVKENQFSKQEDNVKSSDNNAKFVADNKPAESSGEASDSDQAGASAQNVQKGVKDPSSSNSSETPTSTDSE